MTETMRSKFLLYVGLLLPSNLSLFPSKSLIRSDELSRNCFHLGASRSLAPFYTGSGQTHQLSQGSTTGQPQTTTKRKQLMNQHNLMPIAAQPVNRTATGQLPAELAELSEEALSHLSADASASPVLPSSLSCGFGMYGCSYDGDDAE